MAACFRPRRPSKRRHVRPQNVGIWRVVQAHCTHTRRRYRLPLTVRLLRHDGTAVLVQPPTQGHELLIGGAKVAPLGVNRAVLSDPAQTHGQLRRMPSHPTANGMNHFHLHDVDLLHPNGDNGEDARAPAHRFVFSTRDRRVDWARRRERDEPFLIRVRDPHVLNRPLTGVLWVLIQEARSQGRHCIGQGETSGFVNVSYPSNGVGIRRLRSPGGCNQNKSEPNEHACTLRGWPPSSRGPQAEYAYP